MSKEDIIKRFQKLLDDLNNTEEENKIIFHFIDVSLKNLEREKSYLKSSYAKYYNCYTTYSEEYDDLENIRKQIDDLKFSENFERNKINYFNENTEDIKIICDCLDIDYEDLTDDELYEMLLKPETVLIVKNKLFENIKLYIDNLTIYLCKRLNDYDNYSRTYDFDHCRDSLIEFLYEGFRRFYIFKWSKTEKFLTQNGDISVEDIASEIYKGTYYSKYD